MYNGSLNRILGLFAEVHLKDIPAGPAEGEYREGVLTPMQTKLGLRITSTQFYEAI